LKAAGTDHDVTNTAKESDFIPEMVAGSSGEHVSVIWSFKGWTHFLDTGLVNSIKITIAKSSFRFQNKETSRSVLGEELMSLTARASKSAWIVDAFLLAATVSNGTFVNIKALIPSAAHHFHAKARSHRVVLDDETEVAGFNGRWQVHHSDASAFWNAEFDRCSFRALVFTE
jgi:hypothetical protein